MHALNKQGVRRLSAERDVVKEPLQGKIDMISANGSGATSLVQSYINESSKDENVIEEKLLGALNEIM